MVAKANTSPRPVRILWTNATGQSFLITLDAAERERHRLASQVTDHPVESGANVSDNIRPEPDTLEIEGIVTNTPIVVPSDNADGTRAVQVTVDGAPRTIGNTIGRIAPVTGAIAARGVLPLPRQKAIVLGFEPEFDRVGAVYETLRTLRDSGTLVAVITTLRTYRNMALVSVDMERSAEFSNALPLSLAFKEVFVGQVETVAVPALPTKRTNTGAKPTKPVETPPTPEQESELFWLYG